MKTLIGLLLKEQSDQGLHCLLRSVCPKTNDQYGRYIVNHKFLVCVIEKSLNVYGKIVQNVLQKNLQFVLASDDGL